jgi:hypothetical protein
MGLFIEPGVREIVGGLLGSSANGSGSATSLREGLGIGPSDVDAVMTALETEFDITFVEGAVDQARTLDDLVEAVGSLIRRRRQREAEVDREPPRIRVRLVGPSDGTRGTLQWVDRLTPYVAETIAREAKRVRHGTRIEVTVMSTAAADCAHVRRWFASQVGPSVTLAIRCLDCARHPYTEGRALADDMLDELTGARTTVTVSEYLGDGASPGRPESGACDVGSGPIELDVDDMFHRKDVCSTVDAAGERRTWEGTTSYASELMSPVFAVSRCVTEVTIGRRDERPNGLRAQFNLSARASNAFRVRTAELAIAGEDRVCTLVIGVSTCIDGSERRAEIAVRGGDDSRLDVRLLSADQAVAS